MTKKEILRNDILVAMKNYLNAVTMQMLERVLTQALATVEVVEMETLPSTEINTNEYIINLFMARKSPKLSPKTVAQYIMSVNRLCDTVGKSLLHMTDMDIEYFMQQEANRGNSNVSVNNVKRNVSAFFSWMRKSHLVLENPCDPVENRREIEKPIEYLEGYELEELREGCRDLRDRAIFEFLRSTGVRVGEVPRITIQDVDWNNGSILIFANKTQKYRTVVLDDTAKYHLHLYVESRTDNCDNLFVGSRRPTNTMHEDALRRVIKQIAVRAAVNRRIYPHLMRKTFATNLNNKGCPLSVIQQLMGHREGAKTTAQHYIATNTAQLVRAHKQFMG